MCGKCLEELEQGLNLKAKIRQAEESYFGPLRENPIKKQKNKLKPAKKIKASTSSVVPLKKVVEKKSNSATHQCKMCQKVLTTQRRLELHIDIVHSKIKRFACEKCEQSFYHRQRLAAHVKTHENDSKREVSKADVIKKIRHTAKESSPATEVSQGAQSDPKPGKR